MQHRGPASLRRVGRACKRRRVGHGNRRCAPPPMCDRTLLDPRVRCLGCRRPRRVDVPGHRRTAIAAVAGRGLSSGREAWCSRPARAATVLPARAGRWKSWSDPASSSTTSVGMKPVRPLREVQAPQLIHSPNAASPPGPATPGRSFTSECQSKVPTTVSLHRSTDERWSAIVVALAQRDGGGLATLRQESETTTVGRDTPPWGVRLTRAHEPTRPFGGKCGK